MPKLVALRAVFGQDEANHGINRYRVGIDGIVWVPPEAAFQLIDRGGFAVASPPAAVAEKNGSSGVPPGALIRSHHDASGDCSGREYRGDQNGDVIVPGEAAAELTAHGFVPLAANGDSPSGAGKRPPNS
jgi:hypothetical protein